MSSIERPRRLVLQVSAATDEDCTWNVIVNDEDVIVASLEGPPFSMRLSKAQAARMLNVIKTGLAEFETFFNSGAKIG